MKNSQSINTPPLDIPEDAVKLFEQTALKVKEKGFAKYSARTILHNMRWHMHIEQGDRDYKVNDHWSPPLSRWFMAKHNCDGFFEVRERQT